MEPQILVRSHFDRQNYVFFNTFCSWRMLINVSVMAIAFWGVASQPAGAESELPPAIFPDREMPFVEVPPLRGTNRVNNSVIEFGQPLPQVKPRSNNSQMPLQSLPSSLNSLEVNSLPGSETAANENANPDLPASQVERRRQRRRRVRGTSKKRRQSVRRSRRSKNYLQFREWKAKG